MLELFRSMRDEAPESVWIRIAECPDLKLPVLYLKSDFYKPAEVDLPIRSPEHGRLALVAQANYVPEPNRGIDSLAEQLWSSSGDAILSGRFAFSRRNSTFNVFDQSDLAFIDEALKRNDDEEGLMSDQSGKRQHRWFRDG